MIRTPQASALLHHPRVFFRQIWFVEMLVGGCKSTVDVRDVSQSVERQIEIVDGLLISTERKQELSTCLVE